MSASVTIAKSWETKILLVRKKQNVAVEFLDGDMRELQVSQFDAVITIDNAIGHLVKNDFNIAISNIYKNLKSNGIYVFDILNLKSHQED